MIRKESNKLSFMLFIAIIFMNIAATVLFMFISFSAKILLLLLQEYKTVILLMTTLLMV